MTNKEWLLNEIETATTEKVAEYLMDLCVTMEKSLEDCQNDCTKCIAMWLDEEREEKIELKEVERIILSNIPDSFQYIRRLRSGTLIVYEREPKRNKEGVWETTGNRSTMPVFTHLFEFVRPDGDVFSIKELLKEEVD